ncbi:hypothetical protein J3L18_31150 [Mucilaginibacter gossypii]|nr:MULTISPECIES: hypothetical protein [Mucilaginibacter]WMH62883.1 hypothetical protein J3L18_31150 [Mucilaginibacter gossypii]
MNYEAITLISQYLFARLEQLTADIAEAKAVRDTDAWIKLID